MKNFTILVFTISGMIFANSARSQTAARSGKGMNPDMSVNFMGVFQQGSALSNDRLEGDHNGFNFNEAELQFTSDVDPYLRATALFAVAAEAGEFAFEAEEVYMETLSLPSVTLKLGKFKSSFGKQNILHPHAYSFFEVPLINAALLGDEGLNEMGVSAALLLPFSWFSELTLQSQTLSNESLFNSAKSNQLGWLARLNNLWDLNDSTTVAFGISGLSGKNQFNRQSSAWGADLTLKWRPEVGGKYRSIAWTTEYIGSFRDNWIDAETSQSFEKLGGLSSGFNFQLDQRWSTGLRLERLGIPNIAPVNAINKISAIIGFFPSEFSGFRLQYAYSKNESASKADHYAGLQYNISIGAHPAHVY